MEQWKRISSEQVAPGRFRVRFAVEDVLARLEEIGEIPLPPYIRRPPEGRGPRALSDHLCGAPRSRCCAHGWLALYSSVNRGDRGQGAWRS